ncbi:hypothetical protein NMY22_g15422 [Coprinellus aureogranulatus]|nr:hypothetical protein NMY22_g15422 [Coprinellus aureogranulatus]
MPPRRGPPGELNIVFQTPKGAPSTPLSGPEGPPPAHSALQKPKHPKQVWNPRFVSSTPSPSPSGSGNTAAKGPRHTRVSAPPVLSQPEAPAQLDFDLSSRNGYAGTSAEGPVSQSGSSLSDLSYDAGDFSFESMSGIAATSASATPISSTSTSSASTPPVVPALDRRISEILRELRDDYRTGPVGLVSRVFDENNPTFSRHRTEYFKDSSNSISSLLDTLTGSKEGRQKLRQWLESPKGTAVVHDIVSDEMDAVTRAEKLGGLHDITPDFIKTWDVEGHEHRAPFMVSILTVAAQTERAKKENTLKLPHAVVRVIMKQLAYQCSGNSLGFPATFGLFLWACGAPKQVIDAAHHCCLSIDYTAIQTLISNLGDEGLQLAIKAVRLMHAIGYDNMNLSTSVYVEQRGLGTPAKVTSGTWGIIYPLPDANPEHMKLAPIMARFLSLGSEALSFEQDIRPTPELLERVNKALCLRIIQPLIRHINGFKTKAYTGNKALTSNPIRLTAQKPRSTVQLPLRVTTVEEALTVGNSLFHDVAYVHQLKIDPVQFGEYAIPTYNDQLTNSRICSVKLDRANDLNPWERRDPFQPMMGLFHLCINFALALLHVHRGALNQIGSLTFFFQVLNKTRLGGEKPDYHTLISALSQITDGSILSIWKHLCVGPPGAAADTSHTSSSEPGSQANSREATQSDETPVKKPITNLEEYAAALPTAEELFAKANTILQDFITPLQPSLQSQLEKVKVDLDEEGAPVMSKAAAKKKYLPLDSLMDELDPADDIANQNWRGCLRDLLVLDELLAAVAAGDIGRVEDLYPWLLMIFRGAGGTNYANELLWTILNIKHVWTPEFNNIMRDGAFVNTHGSPIPVDLNCEYGIGKLKRLIVAKGLRHTWDNLGDVSAAINSLEDAKTQVTKVLNLGYQSRKHKKTNVTELVLTVARHIERESLHIQGASGNKIPDQGSFFSVQALGDPYLPTHGNKFPNLEGADGQIRS